MKFLHPTFLFALFAVAIPILIHLFSFRRYKTVYFSHVGFLKNIKKESRKKSRLKQLLMLIARILTIVFLVFAFAQPYIPTGESFEDRTGENIVGVYIDNSFSMNALSEQGQLLERARNKAAEIGQAYPPGTKFRLITNNLAPRNQHLFNKDQFIREVAEIQTSPNVIPLSVVHNRFGMQNQLSEENSEGTLYYISDFQRNITDPENFENEAVYNYFLPLTPNQVNNLYIDSCWVEVPAHALNQEETIFVKIKNNSNEDYQNLPLKLYLNDSLKSITNFSVEAQNEITATLNYTNVSGGIKHGKIEITDYPFTHDNTWYISYYVEPKLQALAIYSDAGDSQQGLEYISALFENDDYVEMDQMSIQGLQISRLSEYNTIFLINPENFSSGLLNELGSVVENGSSVVLFPKIENNYTFNNQFLNKFGAATVSGLDTTTQEISGIDFDNRFFRNVFKEREEDALLPEINTHLKFREDIRSDESNLLWFQNGDKALSTFPFGKGKVWVFSFPLNQKYETFARDILFVPSLYIIVLNSLPDQQISYTIGEDQTYLLPRGVNASLESAIEIENRNSGDRFIPSVNITGQGTRLELGGMIETAGNYLVKDEDETVASVAFNYDRQESDLRYFETGELQEKLTAANVENASVIENVSDNFTEVFEEIQRGKQLWKWSILLALFFILTEVLIARFWKQ
ncbi:MAG: BatA domain-containing protein [Tangfeifania sp.]